MLIQASGKLAIRFAAFEQCKQMLCSPDRPDTENKVMVFLSGFAAGGLEASIWITPCERLKTLRQCQIGVPAAQIVHTTWHSSLRKIVQEEGIASVFRGVVPTFWRNAGSVGYRFLVYDMSMEILLGNAGEKCWWHSVLCGAFVGLTSTVLNNPLGMLLLHHSFN
jgi:solute carrier family 25 citrate transporter 1